MCRLAFFQLLGTAIGAGLVAIAFTAVHKDNTTPKVIWTVLGCFILLVAFLFKRQDIRQATFDKDTDQFTMHSHFFFFGLCVKDIVRVPLREINKIVVVRVAGPEGCWGGPGAGSLYEPCLQGIKASRVHWRQRLFAPGSGIHPAALFTVHGQTNYEEDQPTPLTRALVEALSAFLGVEAFVKHFPDNDEGGHVAMETWLNTNSVPPFTKFSDYIKNGRGAASSATTGKISNEKGTEAIKRKRACCRYFCIYVALVVVMTLALFLTVVTGDYDPFSCRDDTACGGSPDTVVDASSFYNCSGDAAARRAGNMCDHFPFYQGGYPLMSNDLSSYNQKPEYVKYLMKDETTAIRRDVASIGWDVELKSSVCLKRDTAARANKTFCEQWTANEESYNEIETGTCDCHEASANGRFCARWTCLQIEERNPELEECDRRRLRGRRMYTTSTNRCYHGEKYTGESDTERTLCECADDEQIDPHAMFCYSWKCTEYDNIYDDYEADTFTESLRGEEDEIERYDCAEAAASGAYCQRWFGASDSLDEFERSRCKCIRVTTSDDGSEIGCEESECFEKGLRKWTPDYWVSLMLCGLIIPVIFFGCRGACASLAEKQCDNAAPKQCCMVFVTLFALAIVALFEMVVVMYAGVVAALCHVVLLLLFPLYIICCGPGKQCFQDIVADVKDPSGQHFVTSAENNAQNKLYTCCICRAKMQGRGFDAAPVREKGRCCRKCQVTKVVPARQQIFQPAQPRAEPQTKKAKASTSFTVIGALLDANRVARQFKSQERIKDKFDAKKKWAKLRAAAAFQGGLARLKLRSADNAVGVAAAHYGDQGPAALPQAPGPAAPHASTTTTPAPFRRDESGRSLMRRLRDEEAEAFHGLQSEAEAERAKVEERVEMRRSQRRSRRGQKRGGGGEPPETSPSFSTLLQL